MVEHKILSPIANDQEAKKVTGILYNVEIDDTYPLDNVDRCAIRVVWKSANATPWRWRMGNHVEIVGLLAPGWWARFWGRLLLGWKWERIP